MPRDAALLFCGTLRMCLLFNLMRRVAEIRSTGEARRIQRVVKARFRDMDIVVSAKTLAVRFANSTSDMVCQVGCLKRSTLGLSQARDLLLPRLMSGEAVEKIGSGIQCIRNLCREHGVAEALIEVSESWVSTTFPRPTAQVVWHCRVSRTARETGPAAIEALEDVRKNYLQPLRDAGWLEMTIPDKPRSSRQKYRLTEKGRELQEYLRQMQ